MNTGNRLVGDGLLVAMGRVPNTAALRLDLIGAILIFAHMSRILVFSFFFLFFLVFSVLFCLIC